MAALLQEKADHYCAQVDQRAWLARSYPGGVASLQRDFYQWLRNTGAKSAHRYQQLSALIVETIFCFPDTEAQPARLV